MTLYCTMLLRALSPYMDYAVNKEYIATFLCINKDIPDSDCHGKCHLKKELKKVAQEEKKTSKTISEEIQFHCIMTTLFEFKALASHKLTHETRYQFLGYHFDLHQQNPPPQFI